VNVGAFEAMRANKKSWRAKEILHTILESPLPCKNAVRASGRPTVEAATALPNSDDRPSRETVAATYTNQPCGRFIGS
jgi:hypothetical protein